MDNFAYFRPGSLSEAIDMASAEGRDVLAGGTTMVDLMRLDVQRPDGLVDITGLSELDGYEIGTDRLRFHDPADMSELGGVDVTRDGAPVTGLNELECVEGRVWANMWPTDTIVRIDPGDGAVDLVVDAAALRERGIPPSAQVLNGIAHVGGDEFLVTGKDWPTMFRVRLG